MTDTGSTHPPGAVLFDIDGTLVEDVVAEFTAAEDVEAAKPD